MPRDAVVDLIRAWVEENTGLRFEADVPALQALVDQVREQCARENLMQSPAWVEERASLDDELIALRSKAGA